MLKNTQNAFGAVSKWLHWIMAILLTGLFAVGLYMTELDYYDALYHTLPWWHKSIGLFVVSLLVLRTLWKLVNVEPQPLSTHKNWEVFLARLIQRTFYVLILVIGITGYFISTAKGKGIEFFTFFEVPALLPEIEEERADLIGDVHEVLAIILALLVALHAVAALKHHFIDKDKTLKRML